MSRLLLLLALPLFAVLPAPAAPIPKHLMKEPTYYFPTKVGAKSEFRIDGQPSRAWLIQKVEDCAGAKLLTVAFTGPDFKAVAYTETFFASGYGLFRIAERGEKLDPAQPWLLLPADHDHGWEYATGDPMNAIRLVVRSGIVEVKDISVPAGTFRCIGVGSHCLGQCATIWYAPDIGIVKIETPASTEVLASFTPGKD